jgi:hypothetical protein
MYENPLQSCARDASCKHEQSDQNQAAHHAAALDLLTLLAVKLERGLLTLERRR